MCIRDRYIYVLSVHTGSLGYFQLFQVAGEGGLCQFEAFAVQLLQPVSYTHLDVYKRQAKILADREGKTLSMPAFIWTQGETDHQDRKTRMATFGLSVVQTT